MTGRSWSPVTSGGVNAPLPSGLRLTTCRWFNRQRRTQSRDIKGERFYGWKWSKVLAHYGHFDQFAYGTDTGVTEEWMKDHRKERHQVQRGTACSIWSRVLMIDVDHEDRFLDTRTAQLVGRQHAFTVRCEGRYHIAIDGRAVPDADWPTQGPIAGADIKSHGFVPWPGSMHYSGDIYQAAYEPWYIVPAWPELIAAINADLADEHARLYGSRGGGGRGGGHGHGGHGGGSAGPVPDLGELIRFGIPEGERNIVLHQLACSRYRRRGSGSPAVLGELRQVLEACGPDFSWEEVLELASRAQDFIAEQEQLDRERFQDTRAWLAMLRHMTRTVTR